MATKIVTKNSSTASAVPTASDLVQGELAVNVADKRLFTEDNAGAIVELGTNPSGNVTFQDNGKAIFGAGSDLQIYHDGTNSYISEVGTGELVIQARDAVTIEDGTSGDNYMYMQRGNKVSLFYAGAEKLSTTATGIDVTGTATMDGLNISNASGGNVAQFTNVSSADLNINLTSGVTLLTPSTGILAFGTSNTERMRIDSSGNVGIGTNSPSGALHVSRSGLEAGITLERTTSATAKFTMAANDGNLVFTDQNQSAERMRIDSAGRVGIGISSMVNPLHVGVTPNAASKTSGGAFNGGAVRLDGTLANAGDESAILAGSNGSLSAGIGFMRESGATWGTALKFYTHSPAITTTDELTERMRITSAGNVGIGTGSPSSFTGYTNVSIKGGYNGSNLDFHNSSGTRVSAIVSNPSADFTVETNTTIPLLFKTNSTERMRIDSSGNLALMTDGADIKLYYTEPRTFITNSGPSATIKQIDNDVTNAYIDFASWTNSSLMRLMNNGNLLVGTTSFANPASGFTVAAGGETKIQINHVNGTGSGVAYATFRYNQSTVGSITQHGTSATLYNTTSDERVKENIADADDAGSKIDAIQVRQYDWKADGSHQDYGMIAQELQAVAPEAVSGDADSEDMMGVDYSKLVPMLVKEIQSLRNRVAQLEE